MALTLALAGPVHELASDLWWQVLERQGISSDPRIEQAKLWPMTYETAEAGKPVVWCVDHVGRDVAYLDGRPSQPIELENDEAMPLNSPTSGGRCRDSLFVVEGRGPRALKLRFVSAL